MLTNLKKLPWGKFLIYLNLTFLILVVGSSYYRFVVLNDYLVAYEGDCDPETQICYEDCDDEDCTSMYYYSVIEREAFEIQNLCGEDITDCDEAYHCSEDVSQCSITYCDPAIEGDGVCATNLLSL